jgi:hypothetical protein
MRHLGYALLFCVIAFALAIVGALHLALENQPLISRTAEFTPAQIERAKRIVEKNDPRTMKPGVLQTISLSQEDLDLALNYLAGRYAHGGTRIVLHPGTAAISATFELPRNPLRRFLNATALVHETATLPRFDYLKIGRLPVPRRLADWLLEYGVRQLNTREDYRIASDTIRKVSVADGRLTVTFDWRTDLPDRIKAVIVPPDEQERLKAYQDRLTEFVRQSASASSFSLAELMTPLFKLAAQRSASGDPAAENRAAIVVLTFYVNGHGLAAIVPSASDWPRPPRRKIHLAGRDDFAQHFTISAAITANAGAPLSDAIGLYKEIEDSRGGSGFSFNDIAADRAGTRFGELAARTRQSASQLQRQVGAGLRDSDIIPVVSDLPEFMPEAEFKRRFGGIDAPPYKRMMSDIERRIAALPLYR